MKTIFLLFSLIALTTFAQPASQAVFDENAPETKFLRQVEQAVRTHNSELLLAFMEKGYKRTQHDELLEGRTTQFLDEFFWCGDAAINFIDITGAALVSYQLQPKSKTNYEVVFWITNGKEECNCTFWMQKNPDTNVLSIYGAVG